MTAGFRWTVADGFIPTSSSGGHEGHESVCVLNASDHDAELTFVAYFADREPIVGDRVTVAAKRARHLRTSDAADIGLTIERGIPYALEVLSDRLVDLQYSRLDTTQPAYTLMTTTLSPSNAEATR